MFDVEAARKAGYSDDDIINHLTQTRKFDIEGAKKVGYSNQDIIQHLSTATPIQKTVPELLWQGVKNIPKSGYETVTGLAGMATHPFRTAEQIGGYAGKIGRAGLEQLFGEPVDIEAQKAVESYAEPVRKSIENPLGTPRRILEWGSEHPVEAGLMVSGGLGTMGQVLTGTLPKTAGALTTAAKVTNPFYLPGVGIEKIVSKLGGAVPPLEEVVTKGMEKGVRPSISGKGTFAQVEKYKARSTDAVRSIVENKNNLTLTDEAGTTITGQLPKNLKQFSQAIEQSKQSIFDRYDVLVKESGQKGATVDLTPISKELNSVVSNAPAIDLNKPVVAYARDLSDTLATRGIYSVKDAQDAIAMLNNRLEAFYKNPTYESASKAYIDSLVANNLRKSLDKVIDGFTGEQYQPLKNQYGSLRSIENDVTHRAVIDARKNVKGLLDFSDVFTGYHVVRGLITLNPSTIAAGGFAKTLAWLYKIKNDPNAIVSKMFSKAEKAIEKEPPFTPYVGPPGTAIPRFPESKYMMGQPITPPSPITPNLPVPFTPPEPGGLPVPTGQAFGVETIRQPRLEWWRGAGAKGIEQIPTPSFTALPPGLGFTMSKNIGGESYPVFPFGKRHAQELSRKREKWYGTPPITDVEFSKEVGMAHDALFKGVPLNKVKEMFKTRTGKEFPG